jgi:hypothetical protein
LHNGMDVTPGKFNVMFNTHTHTQINLVGGLNNIKYHSRENKIGKKNFLKMKY